MRELYKKYQRIYNKPLTLVHILNEYSYFNKYCSATYLFVDEENKTYSLDVTFDTTLDKRLDESITMDNLPISCIVSGYLKPDLVADYNVIKGWFKPTT